MTALDRWRASRIPTLTDADVRTCEETWDEYHDARPEPDGPAIVVLSIGWAEVWPDGDVVVTAPYRIVATNVAWR